MKMHSTRILPLNRNHVIWIAALLAGLCGCGPGKNPRADRFSHPDYSVRLETVTRHWNGEFNWTQARVAALPGLGKNGQPALIMTMQKWFVAHSDYYSGLYTMRSNDMGETWFGPDEQPALGWRHGDGDTIIGICDFTPGWHEKTGKLLAIGHTVYYAGDGKLIKKRPRATAYAVYDPETDEWSAWDRLAVPDENKFYNSGSGCGQWLVQPDGGLLVPVYFKAREDSTNCYASTVFFCRFDGRELSYVRHGDELALDQPRGVYEPSLILFRERYYLTLRNDQGAYVSFSEDALNWEPIRPWTFDGGLEIGSYNTQQHWATHGEGLFLVYTRRDTSNEHIPRSRAPLFMAGVDPDRCVLIKETERILIPQRGVMMGNFGVAGINDKETWVTVGENMHPPENLHLGADGSVFAARIVWSER